MRLPLVFSDRRFRIAVWASLGVALVYSLINVFVIGGDGFVYLLNTNLANPLAILLTIVAATLWRQMRTGSQSRALWGGMCLGWALWAIAEIWWAVAAMTGDEVPYPSWADVFWLTGYLPMILGIRARVRTSPLRATPVQRTLVTAIFVLWAAFSLVATVVPAIQAHEPGLWAETLPNVLYPVFDMLLLMMVLRLLLTYGAGDYGFAWRLLIFGSLLNAYSNTLFLYADWRDLYYPGETVNVLSGLMIDVPYNLSYLVWLLAVFALRILLRRHQPVVTGTQPQIVPNVHVLFSTRDDGAVIALSRNYPRVFPPNEVISRPLGEVLGWAADEDDRICALLKGQQEIVDMPVSLRDRNGGRLQGLLSAIPVSYNRGEYSGSEIVIRAQIEDEDANADADLTPYEVSMARRLLLHSSEDVEIRSLLFDYHLAYFRSLYNLAYREGGAVMAQSLLDDLQAVADARGWRLTFDPLTVIDGAVASLADLRAALPVLLETARQTASLMTDAATVDALVDATHAGFSPAIHANVARYGRG